MATKNKSEAKSKTPALQAPEPPRPGVNINDLTGTPGRGPKVGDSAHQSATEDHFSKGRTTSDSDGTNAGSAAVTGDGKGKKKLSGPAGKVKMGMIVGFVITGRNPGKFRPAIVLRPTDPQLENADLAPIDISVFPDAGKFPNNDHLGNINFREGVLYNADGADGTWHFVEETDAVLARKEKLVNEARAQEQTVAKTKPFGR